MKVIIYNDDVDGLCIIYPNISCGLTIDQIAAKDVPAGKPYKIIDDSQIPKTNAFSKVEVDESLLDTGVGADYGEGSRNSVIGFDASGQPILKAI